MSSLAACIVLWACTPESWKDGEHVRYEYLVQSNFVGRLLVRVVNCTFEARVAQSRKSVGFLYANCTRRADTESLFDIKQSVDGVSKAAQETLSFSATYWKKAFGSLTITKPLVIAKKNVGSVFQSKDKKREAELLAVLGSPLQTDPIQDFATALQRRFEKKIYVLHSVAGATLTAKLSYRNQRLPRRQLEMVVDDDTGNLLTC